MFQVTVSLPSGHSERFSVPESSTVGDLKSLAKEAFGVGFLKLLTAEGHALSPQKPLQEVVQHGDHLTAISLQAKLTASGWVPWLRSPRKIMSHG